MTNKEFKIEIKASADKVWFVLWDDYHYRKWTSVFCEGSYAVTDWKEGSKVHFLSPGGEGMYSTIEKLIPKEKMYFRHTGAVKNFKEQPLDEETKLWSGSREYYSLTENNGVTLLQVNMDIVDQHLDYFSGAFPKGLAMLKELAENLTITIEADVNAPVEKVWKCWTDPVHIVKWNNASDDWHTLSAENDLRVGGKFLSRMEAKDGSMGFDFFGIYKEVKVCELISYELGDGRNVRIEFSGNDNQTHIKETFQPEGVYPLEMQREGWHSILNNFKKYTESN